MKAATVRTLGLLLLVACTKQPGKTPDSVASAPRTSEGIEPGDPRCPATGLWARCSVLYRLERAGVAPHLDTTATPDEHMLKGQSFVVKIGVHAVLDVFLYPDSTARIADERMLSRTDYVSATQPQTIRREKTLIESANLVAFLESINDRQRERVSDALTAGAPQPPDHKS